MITALTFDWSDSDCNALLGCQGGGYGGKLQPRDGGRE